MIKVICGPMFSGKTKDILRLAEEAEASGRKTKLFKPFIDKRYSKALVYYHNGKRLRASVLQTNEKGLERMKRIVKHAKPNLICIDEIHFFPPDIFTTLNEMSSYTDVVVAGLDMDFKGDKFETVENIIKIADEVKQLKAVCVVCGGEATMTQRITNNKFSVDDDPRLLAGSKESYEPRCERCHISTKVFK